MSHQNDIERLQDLMQRGQMTADEANVEMVRTQRYRLVTGSIPRGIRSALNAAVKRGELGHMKKESHRPECYYHPTFDYLAREARANHERQTLRAVAKVAGVQI